MSTLLRTRKPAGRKYPAGPADLFSSRAVSCKSEVRRLPPEEFSGTEAIVGIPGDAQPGTEKNETRDRDRRLAHTAIDSGWRPSVSAGSPLPGVTLRDERRWGMKRKLKNRFSAVASAGGESFDGKTKDRTGKLPSARMNHHSTERQPGNAQPGSDWSTSRSTTRERRLEEKSASENRQRLNRNSKINRLTRERSQIVRNTE
jgi:hypothetical protein